jgi:type I restriction enzyme M protein
MNLGVHGLEGSIVEANTSYEDARTLASKCDLMMANPPFNVDMVDAERVKDDDRLSFGPPGVNKQKRVSNRNYLWISYFHSYLNPKGRAGFVKPRPVSSRSMSGSQGLRNSGRSRAKRNSQLRRSCNPNSMSWRPRAAIW